MATSTNYEISGLTIRRIYDANSFAVFIKGGAFGSELHLYSGRGEELQNNIISNLPIKIKIYTP